LDFGIKPPLWFDFAAAERYTMHSTHHVLRTPQAADYVGLSASTLEKLRLTGNGPSYRKAGAKIVVYRPQDLDAWLEANVRRSTSHTRAAEAGGRQA
jgi:predicted DNA-binding transcriptional regulator AlpA